MSERMETSHLTWRVLRLTEKAIGLLEAGRLDDAIEVVDNRERAMNLLATRADIGPQDGQILMQVEKLNDRLLLLFTQTKENLQRDLAATHKNGSAHRAYHSNQVK